MSAKHGVEHQLWGFLRAQNLTDKKLVIACSGGADSVALVRAAAAVRPAQNLVIAHVHHGKGNQEFRDEAQFFVQDLSEKLQVTYDMRQHQGLPLKSEKELRDVRRGFLEEIRKSHNADFVLTAHHRRDLAETRVLRLLRGTGPEGFRAILPRRGVWVRPFLETAPEALRKYLKELDQLFLEDPSNRDVRSFRNWLRHVWFPSLEDRQTGGVEALGRSLENLAASMTPPVQLKKPEIPRSQWESSAQPERLRLIAECLRKAGQNEMTRGQLQEIERRLESEKREFSFVLGGCLWAVNAHQIRTIRQG